VVKPKLTLFEMQVEGCWTHAAETNQARLGVIPETFNAVDVSATFCKFVMAVIDAKMLTITDIDQAIGATPAVRIDHALNLDSHPE